jgi:hypothetical protein
MSNVAQVTTMHRGARARVAREILRVNEEFS